MEIKPFPAQWPWSFPCQTQRRPLRWPPFPSRTMLRSFLLAFSQFLTFSSSLSCFFFWVNSIYFDSKHCVPMVNQSLVATQIKQIQKRGFARDTQQGTKRHVSPVQIIILFHLTRFRHVARGTKSARHAMHVCQIG